MILQIDRNPNTNRSMDTHKNLDQNPSKYLIKLLLKILVY